MCEYIVKGKRKPDFVYLSKSNDDQWHWSMCPEYAETFIDISDAEKAYKEVCKTQEAPDEASIYEATMTFIWTKDLRVT